MNNYNKAQGFSLVEIAIVLVIVGLLLGTFIGSFTGRIDATRRDNTKKELIDIKQALTGFAFTNGHLPCPDTNVPPDGLENNNRVAGVCNPAGAVGVLPWITLGLGSADAWDTRYRYWVDNVYADDGTVGNVFSLFSANGSGVIQQPDYVADASGATLTNMAENVVAVVFSHGKNTLGGSNLNNVVNAIPATNVDELENDNNGGVFVSRPPSAINATTAGGEFDDIVIWLSEFELKAKMVEAGKLP